MSACFCTGACKATGVCPNQWKAGIYMNICHTCGQQWQGGAHVCPSAPRSVTAPYIPVHERGYPDTPQTEMARLLDLCAKLALEIAALRQEVAALKGSPQ